MAALAAVPSQDCDGDGDSDRVVGVDVSDYGGSAPAGIRPTDRDAIPTDRESLLAAWETIGPNQPPPAEAQGTLLAYFKHAELHGEHSVCMLAPQAATQNLCGSEATYAGNLYLLKNISFRSFND
jgi:hypothetical protein